jgi:hypothetical protein
MNGIATDIELCLWMRLQRPEVLELFARACDELAAGKENISVHEAAAGAARALLRGEDPLATLRNSAELIPDLYEEAAA